MHDFMRVDISGGLGRDAWDRNKTVRDRSLFRGINTFGIPRDIWKKYLNGVEVLDNSTDDVIRSINGATCIKSDVLGERNTLQSLQHPGYQPNRGHLFSDSSWVPNANSGSFGLLVRTTVDGVTTDTFTPIGNVSGTTHTVDYDNFNITKGNIHDLQLQWRGVGNFKTYINLVGTSNNNVLGTLDDLSVSNPSLAARYEAIKGPHTLGGLARTGSAVRFGLGTEQNGIMLEYQYPDNSDAIVYFGCCDVSSEGGSGEIHALGTVSVPLHTTDNANDSTQDSDLHAVLAFRVPENKTINGTVGTYLAYNTRDIHVEGVDIKSNDEGTFYLYRTRNPAHITAAGWETNWSGDVEFAVGTVGAPNAITGFLPDDMDRLFVWGVDMDQGRSIDIEDHNVWATNNDYYLLAFKASNGQVSDEVEASVILGVEK